MLKIENEFVEQLIEAEDPFPIIWKEMIEEIWRPLPDLEDYYSQEKEMMELEYFLVNTNEELYSQLLPKYCTGVVPDLEDELPVLFLDALSLREAILLGSKLSGRGYETQLDYSFSALPSVTERFKDKVGYGDLASKYRSTNIHELTGFSLEGTEKLIWSDFPDARMETSSAGKTVLQTMKPTYRELEEMVFEVLEQLDHGELTIRSDHGYVRHQGAYSFDMSGKDQGKVRDLLGGSRYCSEEEGSDIPKGMEHYVVSYDGYHMAKGRYVWPVSGKYKKLQHGGVSLLECMVPVINIKT